MNAIQEHVLRNLLNDLGNDRATMHMLVDSYLHEAPDLIQEAKNAAGNGDLKTCQRAVHTLKSTSATFGAMDLSALCKEMERESREGFTPTAAEFAKLERMWGEARSDLAHAAA